MGGMPAGGRTLWADVWTWETGPFSLCVGLVAAVLVVLYVGRVRRYETGGGAWPFWRTEAFVAGAVATVAGTSSLLAVTASVSLPVHAVRHVVLMMVAPALLALGRPVTLLEVGGDPGAVRIVTFGRRRLWRVVSHPIPAWVLYLGSMYAMLDDRWFSGRMMADAVLRDVCSVWMLAGGLLYWGALLAGPGRTGTMSYPARMLSIMANMPFEVMAGIWLRYQTRPMTTGGSVAATQLAGEVFIVAATLVSTVWLAVVVLQWAAEARREQRTAAAVAEAPGTGWTVPWWVQPSGLDRP